MATGVTITSVIKLAVNPATISGDGGQANPLSAIQQPVFTDGNTILGDGLNTPLSAVPSAANLDDILDVTITSPQNNQVLTYQGGIWVNDDVPASGDTVSFDTLAQPLGSKSGNTATIYSILQGDGISVVDNSDGSLSVINTITALGSLTNVNVTTPSTGEALVYNGSTWTNQTVSGGGSGDTVSFDTSGDLALGEKVASNATVYSISAGSGMSLSKSGNDITLTSTAVAPPPTVQSYTDYVFQQQGVDRTGATDTSLALQASIDQLLTEGQDVIFPPGTYLISQTIYIYGRTTKQRNRVWGYGAVILAKGSWNGVHDNAYFTSLNDLEEFQALRDVPHSDPGGGGSYWPVMFEVSRNQSNINPGVDPSNVEWNIDMAGFAFDCGGNILIGLKNKFVNQSTFHDLEFRSCWVGLQASGWNNYFYSLVAGGGYIGLWWHTEDGSGCALGSNINTITNCRARGGEAAWNIHGVLPYSSMIVEGGKNVLNDVTNEGPMYRYAWIINTRGTCMQRNDINNIYTEVVPWSQIDEQSHYTIGLVRQVSQIYIHKYFPRYGVRSFDAGEGDIILKDLNMGAFPNPKEWDGIDRNVKVLAESSEWRGYMDSLILFQELAVDRGIVVMNGERHTVNVPRSWGFYGGAYYLTSAQQITIRGIVEYQLSLPFEADGNDRYDYTGNPGTSALVTIEIRYRSNVAGDCTIHLDDLGISETFTIAAVNTWYTDVRTISVTLGAGDQLDPDISVTNTSIIEMQGIVIRVIEPQTLP